MVAGLDNLGNTCFLNSCLQALFSLQSLNTLFDDAPAPRPDIPESTIYNEFNILRVMARDNPDKCIRPMGFVAAVQNVARNKGINIFTGWAQNDITEFLMFLIDCFHEATKTGGSNGVLESSPFHELFYGDTITEIVSADRTAALSSKSEKFFILDLPLETGGNLVDLLQKYIEPEFLTGENQWENPAGGKQDVWIHTSFWSMPRIFVIMLKRFGANLEKDNRGVPFPHDLVVGCENGRQYPFRLRAVCNHMGGVMGGHYTSFMMAADGQWWHCNDSHVERVPPEQVVTTLAYCLFYERGA